MFSCNLSRIHTFFQIGFNQKKTTKWILKESFENIYKKTPKTGYTNCLNIAIIQWKDNFITKKVFFNINLQKTDKPQIRLLSPCSMTHLFHQEKKNKKIDIILNQIIRFLIRSLAQWLKTFTALTVEQPCTPQQVIQKIFRDKFSTIPGILSDVPVNCTPNLTDICIELLAANLQEVSKQMFRNSVSRHFQPHVIWMKSSILWALEHSDCNTV